MNSVLLPIYTHASNLIIRIFILLLYRYHYLNTPRIRFVSVSPK